MYCRRRSALLLNENGESSSRGALARDAHLDYPESPEEPTHGEEGAPQTAWHAPTLRIISTAALIFIGYFTIGLQLAVVPGIVHWQLGYSPLVAGFVVSARYVATLASRPIAGRMGDLFGGKQTSCWGLAGCAASGFVLLAAVLLRSCPLGEKVLP